MTKKNPTKHYRYHPCGWGRRHSTERLVNDIGDVTCGVCRQMHKAREAARVTCQVGDPHDVERAPAY